MRPQVPLPVQGTSARMRSAPRGAGRRGLSAQVGEEGRIAMDAGGGEAGLKVFQDGRPDVGGSDVEVGIEVVGEDGLSAAGGTGVPEELRFFVL